MDEISEQVGCDVLHAGDQYGDEGEEYDIMIKSIEETRNILDSGKFDEVFEENRKQRQTRSSDGGKTGCFLLTIASMGVGATISDNHKKYLRRHAKTIFGDGNALEEFRDALRKYESGVPWHFNSPRYGSSGATDPSLTFSSYPGLDPSATADYRKDAKVSKLECGFRRVQPSRPILTHFPGQQMRVVLLRKMKRRKAARARRTQRHPRLQHLSTAPDPKMNWRLLWLRNPKSTSVSAPRSDCHLTRR